MIEYRSNLVQGNTLKDFDELVNRDALFQILKKSGNGHSAVAKRPNTAKSFWVTPSGFASRPIQHHGTSSGNNSIDTRLHSSAQSAGRSFFTSASLGWYLAPSKNT